MAKVEDITGIGPSKAETLAENGYDSVEALADGDKDELAEISGISDDRALEFIVEASNLAQDESDEDVSESEGDEFDLTPAEMEEELEEDEEDDEASAESEDSDEPPEESEPTYDVTITFDEKFEYDVYHAALMRHYERVYTSHQPASDAMAKFLDGLTDFESVSYNLDEFELNTLHTAVKQQRTDYQGNNLIDQMDALKEVEEKVNDIRRDSLF